MVVRCTFIYEPLMKEKTLPVKLWHMMDYKTHPNSGNVPVWENVSPNQWIAVIKGLWNGLSGPGWCGWAVAQWNIACRLRGGKFHSQSGRRPRLGVQPLFEHVWEATYWCFSLTSVFLSLSLSPPLSLKSISMSVGEDIKHKLKNDLSEFWPFVLKYCFFIVLSFLLFWCK